jgi:pimeloyl-ACP methyl ester carboxylesterase
MKRAEPTHRRIVQPGRPFATRALAVATILVMAYVAACGYLWARQRALIFLPAVEVRATPADAGLQYYDVRLAVAGSAALHGWWLPSSNPAAPALLYLHGNDLNLGANVEAIARLQRLGFDVLAIDYRGYGKSGGGFPSETQLYEDADAAWRYLVRERDVAPARAFIYGHSLGGAVAIELALRHSDAAGIIVEGGFTSMHDMAKIAYWMFPTDWILNQRFDALARVAKLRVPVLFIHGTADREVPYTMSERLFAAAAPPKWLTLVPQGGHEDSAKIGEALYTKAVLDFVDHVERSH